MNNGEAHIDYSFVSFRRLPDWERQNCKDTDTKMFFPDQPNATETVVAKKVCNACCIKIQCLNFALVENMEFGIWGAMTAIERHTIRKAVYG
jgi:WhiB family redox-sensing transcriptional regulator